MRRLAYVTLILLVAACALSFARPAAAIPACPDIKTYTAAGVETDTFSPGDYVNITVTPVAAGPYTILILRPGSPPALFKAIDVPNPGGRYTLLWDNLTTHLGWWTIVAFDTSGNYGVGFFNVVPFAPLGAVAALGACFVGAGIKLRKKQ